jgi:hypothetical protein
MPSVTYNILYIKPKINVVVIKFLLKMFNPGGGPESRGVMTP